LSISNQLIFKDLEVEHITKATLKNYSISLKREEEGVKVVVKTPPRTSKEFVVELVAQKEQWIRKNLLKLNNQTQLKLSEMPDIQKAQYYLTQRVEYFAKKMQLDYKELRFKNLKSRWGSCDSLGVITLNYQLLKVKKELIDYVVVHELAHRVHMNHSKRFHAIVANYIEDAKLKRQELKNSYTLVS